VGFRKQTDADSIISLLSTLAAEARSGYNDGWTASSCKHELYRVKCYLDDVYKQLPNFVGEDEWEKDRVVELLKRK
jgi:uncharacterized membrane protein